MNAIELAGDWMSARKIKNPRIGVCALNPHAGENGLIGTEELQIIAPAIRAHQKKRTGARAFGPLPADSAFRDHRNGKYDCLVTLYHDQSLIPLKLFDAGKLVNISLGLPFPRTSPGHGTAFDIAGKGEADPEPMKEAILTAAGLCRSNRQDEKILGCVPALSSRMLDRRNIAAGTGESGAFAASSD